MGEGHEALDEQLTNFVCAQTGASAIVAATRIQTLWSGYGRLLRLDLLGGDHKSVILKQIDVQTLQPHPRGWQTTLSHERKLHSYSVEMHWYQHWAAECDTACRVPQCLGVRADGGECLILLEDLDAQGFPVRVTEPPLVAVRACLSWLAHFHARFLRRRPEGLWPVGTYWHWETRPDEWAAMPAGPLKRQAQAIDRRLSGCVWQTFVHGDAKVANFCFSPEMTRVAAVDFQYVGGG